MTERSLSEQLVIDKLHPDTERKLNERNDIPEPLGIYLKLTDWKVKILIIIIIYRKLFIYNAFVVAMNNFLDFSLLNYKYINRHIKFH